MNNNFLLQQIFSIPLAGDKYLVYAPLKGIAFIANPSLVNLILEYCQYPKTDKGMDTSLDFLHRLDFFTPEILPKDEYEEKGTQYDAVVLFLTNQCSLRCSYCYASSGEYPEKQMTWEIAKSAIDFVIREVIKNKSPALTLGFHGGGEPTLNMDVLTKATDYVRAIALKNNLSINITGSFNGFWSKKLINYIIHNFTDLSLSFDGLPQIQNHQRPAKGKKDSFQKVAETLHSLDHANFTYGIRMTVTNDSVPYMSENISYICENFKPKKIQVEPVFSEGRAKKKDSAITDLSIFIDQFIKGYKKAEEHGINLFYSGARLEAITMRFCLAACRALVVTPDGDVTTCFEVYGRAHPLSHQFIVGDYKGNGEFSIDKDRIQNHLFRTIQHIPYCEDCFCKWHCAGDCAIKTISGDTGGFQPTDRCMVNQELTKFLILNKIKENKGLIWRNSIGG